MIPVIYKIILNLNEWHDQYVFDLGYNYASKLSTKTSSLVQSKTAKSTALVGTKVKVVFIGNAFLLIDTSGSMNGSRINEAKDGAIKYAKDVLTKGFSPGIITFGASIYYGSEESQVKLVIDCQDHVNGDFQNIINNLKAGGSTPMTEAIQLATVELMRKKGRKIICIVTDGDPDNVNSAVAAASIAKEQGIEIFAVGVDGARQDVLDQLVSKKGMALLTNNLSGGMQKIAGLLN
jgi:Mg-chelatase subunit ChlD